MLEKLKSALATTKQKIKDMVSSIKEIKIPESKSDVKWQDGQPVFTPKKRGPVKGSKREKK